MQSDYSELVERLDRLAPFNGNAVIVILDTFTEANKCVRDAIAAITTLQAELADARNQALEDAAQEADKWFPANSAAKYPTGGVAAAIRAMKDKP